jgi:hypothetical protein
VSLGISDGPHQNDVYVSVDDGHGLQATSEEAILTVIPVPPVLALSGPASGIKGTAYTLGLSAVYPGDPDGDLINGWRIQWGDGITQTVAGSPATVEHVFASAGTYTISAFASDDDGAYDAANTVTVVVQGTVFYGLTQPATVTEATPFNTVFASSYDPAGVGSVSEYSASVKFRQRTVPGTVSQRTNGTSFLVSVGGTYPEEGSYSLVVTIQDAGGGSVMGNDPMTVIDVALSATGQAFTATAGTAFNGAVATFRDPGSDGTIGDSTATITWGDGQSSAGVISGSGGNFTVSGTHTYASPGTHTSTIQIGDIGGATATATGTATVTAGRRRHFFLLLTEEGAAVELAAAGSWNDEIPGAGTGAGRAKPAFGSSGEEIPPDVPSLPDPKWEDGAVAEGVFGAGHHGPFPATDPASDWFPFDILNPLRTSPFSQRSLTESGRSEGRHPDWVSSPSSNLFGRGGLSEGDWLLDCQPVLDWYFCQGSS